MLLCIYEIHNLIRHGNNPGNVTDLLTDVVINEQSDYPVLQKNDFRSCRSKNQAAVQA
jgi:hypothetical protein